MAEDQPEPETKPEDDEDISYVICIPAGGGGPAGFLRGCDTYSVVPPQGRGPVLDEVRRTGRSGVPTGKRGGGQITSKEDALVWCLRR